LGLAESLESGRFSFCGLNLAAEISLLPSGLRPKNFGETVEGEPFKT
jgi:hypothetical protein